MASSLSRQLHFSHGYDHSFLLLFVLLSLVEPPSLLSPLQFHSFNGLEEHHEGGDNENYVAPENVLLAGIYHIQLTDHFGRIANWAVTR